LPARFLEVAPQCAATQREGLLRACEAWLQQKTREDRRELLHV
jgi:hypothetical protein